MQNPFDQFDQPSGPVYGPPPAAPKPAGPPSGFRPAGEGLEYIPGGPADPNRPDKPNLPTGYMMGPGGVAVRIPGIPVAEADDKTVDREITVRKEFEGLDPVKNYRTVLPLFASALQAGDNGAGDLNIIYALGKTMDPGSVVREGELELASTTGSTGEQLKGYFQQVSRGGRLTPVVRKQLLDELRGRTGTIADAYNQVRANYKGLAERYGMDPANIIGLHPGAPFQQAEANFLGRPVRNLDGSQGAAPTGTQPANQIGVFGGGPGQSSQMGKTLTPEQQAAYDALVGSGASPQQIETYLQGIGFNIENAADVVKAREGGAGFISGERAVYSVPEETQRLKDFRDKFEGQAGGDDLFIQGAQLGLGDEAAGVGNAIANTISAPFTETPFDPVGAYQSGRDAERLRLEEARRGAGVGGTLAEIAGGAVSGNPSAALRAAPTLLGRMGQGARAGAAGGSVAGFGYGEGLSSLASAAGGAAGGATLGGLLPVAGTVVGNRIEGARRLMGRDPSLPRRLVNEAVEADANTPAAAGAMMDEAATRGSPMMLADTGENARELLASVGRQPGPSRTVVREAVGGRQQAQTERISEAVHRDLGPTANIQELSEGLIQTARTQAAPLYERFYNSPGVSSVRLEDLMQRPSMRSALQRARRIAAEEGRDPTALGFDLDANGEVTLGRVQSFQTLDYIKQGLDDVIEAYRNPMTGRLELGKEGRAVNATLRTLISRIDNVAPYAAARQAYAGPAAMNTALQKGFKALNKAPDDIRVMMRDMGDSEREAFRLGIRKAIVDLASNKRDGADKVAALIGTPKLRATLSHVFGGSNEFNRFIATLRDEEVMGQTYRSVFGNSSTAGRLAQDAQTVDEGLAEGVVDSALRGETLWGAAVRAFQNLRNVERFGAGQAGQRTRESVAALLSETDPAVLRDLIRAATAAARQQAAQSQGRSRGAVRTGRNVGDVSGMGAGSLTEE